MRTLFYVVCLLQVIHYECQVIVIRNDGEKESFVKEKTENEDRVENKVMPTLLNIESDVVVKDEKRVKTALNQAERMEDFAPRHIRQRKDDVISTSPPPPNIIVLLADDLGYGDLSISGHPTSRTPEIDRLAVQSRFFTHHYVSSPVCSPSRASLLTARQQARSGVYPGTFVPESTLGLPHTETTIAALLKTKGYQTLITGKWHLGVGQEGEFLPVHYGFDDFLGVPYSHDMCPCLTCFPGPKPCYDKCWSDRVSCPLYRAIKFIADAATSNTPFFLYFPFHHVHHPQFASERFVGTSVRGTMGDSLNELDWAVGQVVAALREYNLLSSTLIWFSSDNGPSLTRHERGGCAGLLRCGKGTTWEGGVRVPMFVHWPQHVSPGRSDGLVSALDLLPTLASIVHLNTSHLTLDGVDISPLLWDPLAPSPRQYMALYPESPTPQVGPLAVTNGTYKAHFYTKGSDLSDADNYDPMCPGSHALTPHNPPLLYNLHHDPGERYNLAAQPEYRNVLSDLTAWRDDHMKEMTWDEARTLPSDRHAQPCCSSPSCTPFPQCCDCPAPPKSISS